MIYDRDGDGQLLESVEQMLVRALAEFVKLRVSEYASVYKI